MNRDPDAPGSMDAIKCLGGGAGHVEGDDLPPLQSSFAPSPGSNCKSSVQLKPMQGRGEDTGVPNWTCVWLPCAYAAPTLHDANGDLVQLCSPEGAYRSTRP